MEWISVEKSIRPKEDNIVVGWGIILEEPICIKYVIEDNKQMWIYLNDGDRDPFKGGFVTHWIPLPEPPNYNEEKLIAAESKEISNEKDKNISKTSKDLMQIIGILKEGFKEYKEHLEKQMEKENDDN